MLRYKSECKCLCGCNKSKASNKTAPAISYRTSRSTLCPSKDVKSILHEQQPLHARRLERSHWCWVANQFLSVVEFVELRKRFGLAARAVVIRSSADVDVVGSGADAHWRPVLDVPVRLAREPGGHLRRFAQQQHGIPRAVRRRCHGHNQPPWPANCDAAMAWGHPALRRAERSACSHIRVDDACRRNLVS